MGLPRRGRVRHAGYSEIVRLRRPGRRSRPPPAPRCRKRDGSGVSGAGRGRGCRIGRVLHRVSRSLVWAEFAERHSLRPLSGGRGVHSPLGKAHDRGQAAPGTFGKRRANGERKPPIHPLFRRIRRRILRGGHEARRRAPGRRAFAFLSRGAAARRSGRACPARAARGGGIGGAFEKRGAAAAES